MRPPSPTAALNVGISGLFEGGLELLNCNTIGLNALYPCVGTGITAGQLPQPPLGGGVNVASGPGFVFDMPTPADYRGGFVTVTVSGAHIHELVRWQPQRIPYRLIPTVHGSSVSIFRGSTDSTTGLFSHGLATTTNVLSLGGNPTIGRSVRVAVSWYCQLWESPSLFAPSHYQWLFACTP